MKAVIMEYGDEHKMVTVDVDFIESEIYYQCKYCKVFHKFPEKIAFVGEKGAGCSLCAEEIEQGKLHQMKGGE